MEYETLLNDAEGVIVEETNALKDTKGIFIEINKQNIILINKDMTNIEKKCILAEELGHFYTTSTDISDQSKVVNIKQEKAARNWAYARLICIEKLIKGYKSGCRNRHEIAEFLNITEDFLQEALDHYIAKYGRCYKYENIIITLEPLGILETFT